MSTEQENFDDLLKSKLNENEFAFNEASWEKAEALIIQAEKKRKRRFILFILFIGIVLGVCVTAPFINWSINDKNSKLSAKNIKTDSRTENVIEQQTNNSNAQSIASEKKGLENNQINSSLENAALSGNIDKAVSKEKGKIVVSDLNSREKQKNNSPDMTFTKNVKNSITKTKQQKGSEQVKENNTDALVVEEKKIANNKQVEAVQSNIKNIKKSAEEIKDNPISKPLQSNATIPQSVDSVKKQTLVANIVVKDSVVLPKDSITKQVAGTIKPAAKDSTQVFKKVTIFSIDAGANYALGWANNSIQEANGLNAIFGLSLTHHFVKKWGILVGVQYNNLTHLNYSNYTSNNLQYGFGYNQTKTVITPTSLYYLAVPIKLQYYLNEKNSLSLGINVLYLLNTNSKVETYTRSTFDAAPAYKISTQKGYRDGFSSFDFQPALAYHLNIIKCLSINAELYYGLIDIKNNSLFGLAKAEHNSGFKLTLSYNLIRK